MASLLLLCAGPRPQGTSAMLLKRIREKAGGEIVFLYRESTEEVLEKMKASQTIVVSGPCYINSFPSRVSELLEAAAEKGPWEGRRLYGMINGGMPYIHTHAAGLETLKLFAAQCGFAWKGGFVLGGGAMLDGQALEKHLSRKRVVPAFDLFAENVRSGQDSPDELYLLAQPPPGPVLTFVMSKLLSFLAFRRIRQFGHDPADPGRFD